MHDDDDDFRVERRLEGGVAVVAPHGDIDLKTADAVRAELAVATRGDARKVVIDLRGVTFMDSSGIRLLIETQVASQRDGFAFAVVRGPEPVQRLLEIAGLLPRMPFVDDPSQAPGGRPDAG